MVCVLFLSSTVHKLQWNLLGAWGGSWLKKLRDVIMYWGMCGEPGVLEDPLQSLFLGCCGTLHVYMIRSLADNSNNFKFTDWQLKQFHSLWDASKWHGLLKHVCLLKYLSGLYLFSGICGYAPLTADYFPEQSSKAKHVLRQNCLKANLAYPLKAQQSLLCLKDVVSVF